jgi:hypothetical protein
MACSFFLDLTAQDTGLVFFLIHLELRRHPTNLAYISSRLLGWSIVLKTSEPIWRYPVFAFICYVSIHLEISAAVVRSAPEELPKRRRKATIADTTDRRVLTAIAAAVQMGLMKPVLRGKPSGVLVGREPSHLVLSR